MNSPSIVNGPGGAGASPSSLSRRRFVSTMASTAAFSIVSPALAFGSQANARLTVGMIGLGGRGAWMADHIAKQPGFQITALADYFPEAALAAGERLKVPKERCFSGLDGYRQLYANGMKRNVETFYQSIVAGDCANPTVEPSVHATLATILGREAALRGRRITGEELLKDTTRLEPDFSGLNS
ncbi:MAG: hypothetical protein HY717_20120 [Planctomycetes bacterium]|nr:hypothetical protein [Planctomycetota bacterium]